MNNICSTNKICYKCTNTILSQPFSFGESTYNKDRIFCHNCYYDMTTEDCQKNNPVAFWVLGFWLVTMLSMLIVVVISFSNNTTAVVQKPLVNGK